MKEKTTERGFNYNQFTDANDVECSIQISSAIQDEYLIWLGANEIGLKEFVAHRKPSAWMDIELEESMSHHYMANNRMHLTQSQVKELIPVLQRFVETGDIR